MTGILAGPHPLHPVHNRVPPERVISDAFDSTANTRGTGGTSDAGQTVEPPAGGRGEGPSGAEASKEAQDHGVLQRSL